MTISTDTARTGPYAGNGSTTVFAYSFKVVDQAHLVVTVTTTSTGAEVVKELTTHYSVSGVGDEGGGNVTMGSAPASGETLTVSRSVTKSQTTDLVNRGSVQPETLETALDRGVQMVQDLDEQLSRGLKLPVSTNLASVSSTIAAPVADAFIKWNSAGTALTTSSATAGQALGADGSAGAPYYSFTSDTNSGFYRIGSDNVGLSLGGTKKVDFGAATTAFTGEVTATGFTGTLDGSLGSGTPAAAVVTQLTSGGVVVSDTDSTDDLGTTGVRWRKLWVDAIQTTDNVDVSGNLVVTGNLTINGTTVTNDAVNLEVKDPLIELNSGAGSNANDLGLVMERGSTGNNAFMGWDESADKFAFGTTTATGASTGNITYADAQVLAEGATFSGTSPNLGTVTTVDINGGTVDGATIGASSQTTGQFTNLTGTVVTASTSLALASGATITGINDTDAFSDASATTAATSESIKAYVDSNLTAAGIQMTWETATTDTDQGVGKVFANNATLSSATVLYFDDVERNGVSINSFIDSLDDPTATNSATIYISEGGTGGAGVVFQVSGAVTSASTYSKVAVTHVATYGTLTDGDLIGVVIAFSGNNGSINNIVEDSSPQLGADLDANGHQIQWSKGADVASNSALAVGTDGNYFDVTGTTTITSINSTGGAGTLIKLHFDGACQLTHHASNLILAGAANFTTEAGDELEFVEYGSGTYRMTGWCLAGTAPGGGGGGAFLGEGASGASVGNSGDIIRVNENTLNTSQTMAATDNGSATGPLSIASGVTLTISSGATFAVI